MLPILSVKNGPGSENGDKVYCLNQTACDKISTVCLPGDNGNFSCECRENFYGLYQEGSEFYCQSEAVITTVDPKSETSSSSLVSISFLVISYLFL